MGNCCQRTQKMRILLLGLDAAGKTTILYSLKDGIIEATEPTIGFNIETIIYKNFELNIWDVGGQDKLRDLWRHHYPGTNAILFIVDSADRNRLVTAKEELHLLLNEHELRYATLCVVCNKQDLPNALKKEQISKALELSALKRTIGCFEACAKENKGLTSALDFLIENYQPI